MDHHPPAPDPTQSPPDHRHSAVNAAPQDNHGEEEGLGQQKSLPLKNFRALVFKFIKPLTPADESLIEHRLLDFFPAIHTIPDHPPYSAMIEEAVEKLNGGRGCSEEAISEYIKNEYKSLPWAHPTILAHHLNKLSKKGDIIVRCGGGYILGSAIIPTMGSSDSDSPSPRSRRLKRKRKRKRKMNRTKIQIQGTGRGRIRKHVPGRGRGRPRKKDEIDENFKLKWLIQGRKLGRRKKNDETSEGYQLKEEQTGVPEEHHRVIKEHDQPVQLELDDRNQVANMEMEESKENNEIQVENQVVLEQSEAEEEQNVAFISESRRGGSSEVRKDQKQENGQASEEEVIATSPSPSTDSDYSPCSSSSERGSDSLGSECSTRRRPLKMTRSRNKSQVQEKERGRGRKHIPGRGRGRPRKKDEIDRLFPVHDEKFMMKRIIQRSSRKTINGKKWGKPRKNNKTSEEHTDVAGEHNEDNQLVDLVDVIEDHNQVADLRMNDAQVQNQVVLEQNKVEEEQNIAITSEPQGEAVEEREKNQKQEKVFSDVPIQPAERQNNGREENEQDAEKEVIVDQNQPWKHEKVFIEDKQDELFGNCNRELNQEREVIVELNQSVEEDVILVGYGSIEQEMEVIEDQIHPSEQRELEFKVTEKEQQNRAQEGVQQQRELEFDVSEGQCQKEEQQTEAIQLEDRVVGRGHQDEQLQNVVVPEDIQQEDKVIEEKQDVQMTVTEEQKAGEAEGLDGQREEDKGGCLEHDESEKQETDALEEQNFQQKQLIDVIVEQNQICQEKVLQQKQILDVTEDKIQQCETPEKEILGAIRSEEEGGLAEEFSEDKRGERAEVKDREEQANDVSEEQHLVQEQGSQGNKEKLQACGLSQPVIMVTKDQEEQEIEPVDREKDLEEELNVEALKKENQLKGKRNVVNVESIQSCDVRSNDSTALPCKTFWSLMEDEKDKFLNNFRYQEMKSPCREGDISDSSIKSEQELFKLPLLKSSPKSGIEEVSCIHDPRPRTRLQLATSHTGEGRSSELKICGPDHQNKSEQRRSGRESLRPRSRNVDEVATSENQPVRRSPRHLNTSSEELDQSKERPKRPGLRSEKNKKGGV